ncbi:MAG: hypothetical protein AB8I08_27645 [Sandaracinaceae bacterium]
MSDFTHRLGRFVKKHRTRLSQAALAVFLVAVGLELTSALPRSIEVSVPLGTRHAQITEARIEYRYEGQMVHSVTRHFSSAAPREVRNSLELSPGEYDVSVWLVDSEGQTRALRGSLSAPSDGVVRLALEDR